MLKWNHVYYFFSILCVWKKQVSIELIWTCLQVYTTRWTPAETWCFQELLCLQNVFSGLLSLCQQAVIIPNLILLQTNSFLLWPRPSIKECKHLVEMNNFTPHEQRALKAQEENKTGEIAKAKLPAEVSTMPVTWPLYFQA